ncbi:hypothetical protein AWV80_09730 [Cupriavidus sp. UYMU48A]|nr:hypothetical protein AWV80_09730 [Cupriavidus sp. UYMU48A]
MAANVRLASLALPPVMAQTVEHIGCAGRLRGNWRGWFGRFHRQVQAQRLAQAGMSLFQRL